MNFHLRNFSNLICQHDLTIPIRFCHFSFVISNKMGNTRFKALEALREFYDVDYILSSWLSMSAHIKKLIHETMPLSSVSDKFVLGICYKYPIITLSFVIKHPFITLSFVIKRPFLTLSFVIKHPIITLFFCHKTPLHNSIFCHEFSIYTSIF